MLAQNFKTTAELKITDAEFDALLKVLGMLERGELRHVQTPRQIRGECFNLNWIEMNGDCGTAHCIGGWVATSLKLNAGKYMSSPSPGLRKLYWPWSEISGWSDVTAEQAAIAVRSYLTHGEPRWAEALA